MELLGDSDEWADVEPLPQDDGPDPVVPIAYSREFDDAMSYMRAVLASGERTPRVLRLTERVISVNAASYTAWQLRRDVLSHLLSSAEPVATSAELSSTSAGGSPGNYLPDLSNSGEKEKVTADSGARLEGDWLVQDEVLYAENVTLANPKNYQVWHHRRWLADLRKDRVTRHHEQMQQQQQEEEEGASKPASPLQQNPLQSLADVAQEEFRFCEEALRGDSKNYHAWCHRQWVAREFDTWHGELAFCERLLDDDVRNNSAWNHRMFVLEHLMAKQKQRTGQLRGGNKEEDTDSSVTPVTTEDEAGAASRTSALDQKPDSDSSVTLVTVEDEVAFAVTAIWLAPSNESPWRYLQGLIRLQENEAAGAYNKGYSKLQEICLDVLGKEPECVHALAALLSVLGKGFMSDRVGLVLGLTQGARDDVNTLCMDAAVAVCEKLQKVDKIRWRYWEMRKKQCMLAGEQCM
ncbi:hypothetical protein CLOP_g5987 [Closterium sp. NIES-67]|nr:hypothetical protein CLOP_g5987 [Closterium sp. NIES-67]